MKMKRTWFSYLLWLLYTAAAGVLLASCITSASINSWGFGKSVTVMIVCLSYALAAGIWFMARRAAAFMAPKMPKDPHFYYMWECFLGMCLFAGAVLCRIYYLLHVDVIPDAGAYFELAQVNVSGGIPEITHGASYVYTAVLTSLFTFFGNRVAVGIYFQFLLQIIFLPVFYFAVRLIAGRISALTAAALMVFSPLYLQSMCLLSPENLYLVFYAAGLLLTGLYLDSCRRGGIRGRAAFLFLFLTGLYIGMMVYLDITGITLLFFAGMDLFMTEGRATAKGKRRAWKQIPGYRFSCIISGMLLAILLLAAADAVYSGQTFGSILTAFAFQYRGNGLAVYRLMGPDTRLVPGGIVCLAALLLSVGFWFHKTQKSDAWILLLLTLFFCDILNVGPLDYSILATAVWGVFSGLGITSIPTAIPAGQNAGNAPCMVPGGTVQEGAAMAADDGLEEIIIEGMPEEIIEEENKSGQVVKEQPVQEKPPVRFIENPLPLPKKHEKKEMEYGVELKENDKEFDLQVEDSDDFDLK